MSSLYLPLYTMNEHNLTSLTRPRAPAIIHLGESLVSSSDYGHEEMRKLLSLYEIPEESIDQIMASRTLAKLGHAYKEEVVRRTGERYFDHPSGVTLLLLFELGVTDPDILSAGELHDVLEDVKVNRRELENLLSRAASPESLRITRMVTNPEKTENEAKNKQIKERHYYLISNDRKASFLKIADRMYNLRSLEVFHIDSSTLTEKHLRKAQEQIDETRKYILPIAERYGLKAKLLLDIERVEKRASEVALILLQNSVKCSVVV